MNKGGWEGRLKMESGQIRRSFKPPTIGAERSNYLVFTMKNDAP